jgi:NAD(P)H-hydrate repair Nnr-like enzyme with NAD(P)H-hydrate dehydratase domain
LGDYKKMKNNGLITQAYVNTFIKKRDMDIHKGNCGRVLVYAGSKGMAGAAVLCARAALRTGAGLVRVSVP